MGDAYALGAMNLQQVLELRIEIGRSLGRQKLRS
jgi:hypothetical protein